MWTCYTVTSVLHISQLWEIKGITGWVRLKWITFGKSRVKVRRSSFDLWGMENKQSQWQYRSSFLSQKWAFCLLNTVDMFPIKASSQAHTVKSFGIVNKAEINVFLELSCFFNDPADVGNLISGCSHFYKTRLNIWKFLAQVLLRSVSLG